MSLCRYSDMQHIPLRQNDIIYRINAVNPNNQFRNIPIYRYTHITYAINRTAWCPNTIMNVGMRSFRPVRHYAAIPIRTIPYYAEMT